MSYRLKPSLITESSIKQHLKVDALIKKLSDHENVKMLAVFKDNHFLTILPFKLFKKNLSDEELNSISYDLFIYPVTYSIDPGDLKMALEDSRAISGRIIIRLPFLCSEFPVMYKITHPFIDMRSFTKETFVTNRIWLARQQKKWSDFQFSFAEFDYKCNRDIVSFYFKNVVKRFKFPRDKVLHQLENFQQNSRRKYVALLRDKTNIVAVIFLKKNLNIIIVKLFITIQIVLFVH